LRSGSTALSALHASQVPLLVVPARFDARLAAAGGDIPLLRSILVATDLSDLGNSAVPHAYALARRAGTRVELCHVHERSLAVPAYGLPDDRQAIPAERRRELERRLAALVPRQADDLGIVSHVTVIDGGAPAEQILMAARRLGADAIVVSSHGRGGVSRALLGSVAEAVIRGSDRPVYVVRPGA